MGGLGCKMGYLDVRWVDLDVRWVDVDLGWVDLNLRWVDLDVRWAGLDLRWVDLDLRWMDGHYDSSLHTTPLVIFLLILSTLGMVWTVSCSWLTGRKKRQRVGHNSEIDDDGGLVLQINRPVGEAAKRPTSVPPLKSPRCKSTDRYSVPEQSLGVISEDLGRSLRLPTIIVTPPTPVDMFPEVTSLGSGDSIGTADDLIMNSEEGEGPALAEDAQGVAECPPSHVFTRGASVRDSMRNRSTVFYSDLSLDSLEGAIVCDVTTSNEVKGHPMSTHDDTSTILQTTSAPEAELSSALPESFGQTAEEVQIVMTPFTHRPLPDTPESAFKIPKYLLSRHS
ncbi:hypothetical protein Btru_029624 [Bulinus truncatus]|nr:hypothetical protein Btru_029624 [Bulinus truncatus]